MRFRLPIPAAALLTLAVLAAPDAGTETRRRIASKAREIVGRARPVLEEAKEEAKHVVSSAMAGGQTQTHTGYGSRDVPIG